MRTVTFALLLVLSFTSCSRPKTHFDPVMTAAENLLTVAYGPRAFDKLQTLEIEIDRAKQRGTTKDKRALAAYGRAVDMFRLSHQQVGSKSEELWGTAVMELRKAQRERMRLPEGTIYFDPPMSRPIKQPASDHVR